MKRLLLVSLTVACIVISGCGKHTYHGEQYKRKSMSGTSKIDKFQIKLSIAETHPEFDGNILWFLLSNTHEEHGYPNKLLISSQFYGRTDDPVKICEIKMTIGSQPEIILLDEDHEDMLILYKPWIERAVSGNLVLPLGDKLPFVKGQKVTVVVKYQPPESSQIYEVKTVFEGTVTDRSYTSIDVLNSV